MSSKEVCKYGNKCYRKNPDHLKNFSHNDSLIESNENTDYDESSSEPNILETTQDKRDNLADDVALKTVENNSKSNTNLLDKIEKIDLTQVKGELI